MKRFLLIFFILIIIGSYCFGDEYENSISDSYDEILSDVEQQQLVANLNYIQYAISKIKATDNKAIAEDIYYSVLNQIKIETINSYELNELYSVFLESCAVLKLQDNEKKFLQQQYSAKMKDAIYSSFTSMGSVFVPGSFSNPYLLATQIAYTALANYTSVMNKKSELSNELMEKYFYLEQDYLSTIYDLQTQLFSTSANLLSKTRAKGRITDDSMNRFVKILNSNSYKAIISSLTEKRLKDNFELFPPYWFELGNAYQQIGNFDKAIECYDKFESLKAGDVVEKDSFYVKLARNRISILLAKKESVDTKSILKYLDIIDNNSLDSEAGEKHLYFANVYFSLGEYKKALDSLEYVINAKETDIQYHDSAVSLKTIIKSFIDTNDSIIYKALAMYDDKLIFGNNFEFFKKPKAKKKGFLEKVSGAGNTVIKKTDEIISDNFSAQDGNNFSKFMGKNNYCSISPYHILDEKSILQNYDEDNNEKLCLLINNGLINDASIAVYINNKECDCVIYNFASSASKKYLDCSLMFVDYPYSDLERNIKCDIAFVFTSKDVSSVMLKGVLGIYENKFENIMQTAFDRIKSERSVLDIKAQLKFYKQMKEYKYHIKDINKEYKDILKQKKKEGKKYNLSAYEIEKNTNFEYKQKISVDVDNIEKYIDEIKHHNAINEDYVMSFLEGDAIYNGGRCYYYFDTFGLGSNGNIDKYYYINTDGDIKIK